LLNREKFGQQPAFSGCVRLGVSYDGLMKNALTLLASLFAISSVAADAIAIDARAELLLTKAHRAAHAATLAYAKQPNGTTHALADATYCDFSDQLAVARARGFVVVSIQEQVEAVTLLRASVKLPIIDCTHPVSPFKI
jgi:hypothetical protein